MKRLITNYVFDASAKQVTLTDFASIVLERMLLITNVNDNIIIYNFAKVGRGGTVATNIVTLDFDTTAMDDSDELQIFYDDPDFEPANESTLAAILDAVDTLETKAQSLIDNTDGIETDTAAIVALLTSIGTITTNIETVLNTINTNIDELEGFTDEIEGILTTIAGFVDQLEGFTDNIENLLTQILAIDFATETTLQAVANSVDTVEIKLQTIIDNTDGIETQLTTIAGFVDQLEGFTDGIETLLTTISTSVDTVETKLQTLIDNTDGLEGFTDTVEIKLQTLIDQTDGIEGSLTTINASILAGNVLLTSISGFVDQLEGFTDGIEAQLTTITAAIDGIETSLSNIETDLGAPADAVVAAGATGSLSAKLRRVTTDLGALLGFTDGVEASLTTIEGDLGLPADAAVAAGATGSISAKLRRLTTDVGALLGFTDGIEGFIDGIETLLTTISATLTGGIKTVNDSLEVSGTGAALNATPIPATDVSKYKQIGLTVTGTFVASYIFECSPDGVSSWQAIPGEFPQFLSFGPLPNSNLSNLNVRIPVYFKFFRVRLSAYVSGTVSIAAIATTHDAIPLNSRAMQLYNTSGSGADYNSGAFSAATLRIVTATNDPNFALLFTYVDGLETLLNTINTNIDQIEGFVDGIETLLTTISGNIDQLEGYLDTVEAKLQSIIDNTTMSGGTVTNGAETAVAGSAVQVLAANSNRAYAIIQNTGLANMRVGVSGVTATTGYRIVPNGELRLKGPKCPTQAIFAIREGAISTTAFAIEST